MKNQESNRVNNIRHNYIKIYIISFLLCLVVAAIITITVLDLSNLKKTPSETTDPEVTDADSGSANSNTDSNVGNNSGDTNSGSNDPSNEKITYVEYTSDKLTEGSLILVNKSYAFDSSKAVNLETYFQHRNDAFKLSSSEIKGTADTVNAFSAMFSDYKKESGFNYYLITSGYRTEDEQTAMASKFDADYVAKYVAPAGYSEHHTGLAIDLKIYYTDGATYPVDTGKFANDYNWLLKNCAKYGLILRYTQAKESVTGYTAEPWHFRYVGIAHASYITENDICLEEYLQTIKNYNYNSRLDIKGADGSKWSVYYVAAEADGSTSIPVPTGATYTVSGNNYDGFIVTIQK